MCVISAPRHTNTPTEGQRLHHITSHHIKPIFLSYWRGFTCWDVQFLGHEILSLFWTARQTTRPFPHRQQSAARRYHHGTKENRNDIGPQLCPGSPPCLITCRPCPWVLLVACCGCSSASTLAGKGYSGHLYTESAPQGRTWQPLYWVGSRLNFRANTWANDRSAAILLYRRGRNAAV